MGFQILQKNIKGCGIFYPIRQVIPNLGTTDCYLFQAIVGESINKFFESELNSILKLDLVL